MIFAGRELVTIQSYAHSVFCRFMKDVCGILEKLKSNIDFHCKRWLISFAERGCD